MSDWIVVRHRAAIAGRVTNLQTKQAIGAAVVGIIDAPPGFIGELIVNAKMVGLQDTATGRLFAVIDDSGASNAHKLQAAQLLMDYDGLFARAGLAALRGKAISALSQIWADAAKSLPEKLQASRTILNSLQRGTRRGLFAGRSDRTETRPDGHYHFMDLPQQAFEYTLSASLPGGGTRYGDAQKKVKLTLDGEGAVNLATADIELPSTSLRGSITTTDTDGPVSLAMVNVIIKGSSERTFSDTQGRYLLAGLEIGKRSVEFSARGYDSDFREIVFSQPGEEKDLDLVMTPSSS